MPRDTRPDLVGEQFLGRAVRSGGVHLATVYDVVLERQTRLPLGFEVRCVNGESRFLALAACEAREDGLEVATPLTLLPSHTLPFYREQGLSLRHELQRDSGFDIREAG